MRIPTPPEQPPHLAVHQEAPPISDPSAPPVPAPSVEPSPPTASARKGGRKHLYFGFGGLAAGLAGGFLLGALGSSVGGSPASSSASPSASSNTRPISAAVSLCSLYNAKGVSVMDGGKSLEIKTAGKLSTGVSTTDLACVFGDLKTPQSIIARMESTRALDGTQNGTWAEFTASWTYHPDRGLNIVIETVAK